MRDRIVNILNKKGTIINFNLKIFSCVEIFICKAFLQNVIGFKIFRSYLLKNLKVTPYFIFYFN